MNGYADNQLQIVKQFQAERRAEATAYRLVAAGAPRGAPEPADGQGTRAARLLVTLVLVAVGMGGLMGAGTLIGGPIPVQGPTPDFAG